MIWKLRVKKHLSIRKMSELLNVSMTRYVLYEVSESLVPPQTYIKLSYILQFDINH